MLLSYQQNSSQKVVIIVIWMKSRSRYMIWSKFWIMVCYVLVLGDKIDIMYSDVIKCGFSQ